MAERHPMTLKPVLFQLPGTADVAVRREIEYRRTDAGSLTMDLYHAGAGAPAVIMAVGYSDVGARTVIGCAAKDMEAFVGWARLIAASGMTAIAYCNGGDPSPDLDALLEYVRTNARDLGVDPSRIGLWACSGHVPTALSALIRSASAERISCAALLYGYTMDLDGAAHVAEAANTFRFRNACAGRTIDDLPAEVPIFVARAGRDEMPGLNTALDRFVAAALARNLPIALANHPTGVHAFDLYDDGTQAAATIRQTLGFLRAHLLR